MSRFEKFELIATIIIIIEIGVDMMYTIIDHIK